MGVLETEFQQLVCPTTRRSRAADSPLVVGKVRRMQLVRISTKDAKHAHLVCIPFINHAGRENACIHPAR